jgi:hypothetical protein
MSAPRRALALVFGLVFSLSAGAADDWIARSNEDAQPLLKVIGDFGPEFAGQLGMKGYDDRIQQLPSDNNQRFRAAIEEARKGLEAKLATE